MIIPSISSRQLVGRDTEIHALADARRDAAKAHGRVVLVGGEAGIGKTRLLGEFLGSIASQRAPHIAIGECLQDAPRPFGPFRSILARLTELAPDSLSLIAADPSKGVALRTLATLVPDAMKARGIRDQAPPQIDKAELFAGFLHYVESVAAKRAVILAVEDLHWADSASLELLTYVAPRIGSMRLIVIGTYRNDEITNAHPLFGLFGRLEREHGVRRIALEPLAERDIRSLIHNAIDKQYTLNSDELRDVVSRSEGNPFFTEEILKNTLERQAELRPSPLPMSIRALTLARLHSLDAADRALIEHAAVFGHSFDADSLATIMGRDRRDVLIALRRMREHNLVVEEPDRRMGFRFRHVLTRQAIYDELLTASTRELHGHIVRSLEARKLADSHLDELAYHAWKAGMREATLAYSERAGDAALALRAAAQAATYYERALEFTDDDAVRIRLLGKAGEAYVQQSDFNRATSSCMIQHEMLLRHEDYNAAALALTRAAGEFANSGQVQRALDLVATFDTQYGERLDVATADHIHASAARMATVCDDYDCARTALLKVRHPESLAAFTHQVYWLAQLFCSEHAVDASLWRRAASALRARNAETYPLMRSQMLHSIASTAIVFAEHEEALRSVDEALAIDRELGFSRALAYANSVKASILCLMGRLAESRACALEAFAEQDMFVVRIQMALAASPAALALADDELAERCLDDDMLRRLREAGMHSIASAMLGMQARRLFGLGRHEEARRSLDESVDGPQHQFAALHVWPFASRHLDDARLARLRSLCAEYGANPDYRVMHACAALLEAVAARRAVTAGEDGDIATLAQIAADRYAELGWPMQRALALEIGDRIDEAVALYKTCGSIADVRRLETSRGTRAPHRREKSKGDGGASRTAAGGRLSAREREVAMLVAQGLSNKSIANQLCVGEKTIEKYVTAIYAKLSFSTRAQLAAYIARAGATG